MKNSKRANDSRLSSGKHKIQDRVRKIARKVIDLSLVTICAAVGVYLVVAANQMVSGFSLQQESSGQMVRLEIVNASGVRGLTAQICDQLEAVASPEIEIDVAAKSMFNVRTVEESYIISRQENCQSACQLAEKLGLDPGSVAYKPMVNNSKQIAVTLILGSNGISPATAVAMTQEK